MTAPPILISLEDAAVLLSTTSYRLRKLARDGRVPFVDLGDGEMRFSPDELRAWVQHIPRREVANA
jgi:excisionase family DNA binding protein